MSCVLCVLKLPQHCSECRLGLRQWRPDSSKASESHSWGFLFCERYQLDFESVPSVCAPRSHPPPVTWLVLFLFFLSQFILPLFSFPWVPWIISSTKSGLPPHPGRGVTPEENNGNPSFDFQSLGEKKKVCVCVGGEGVEPHEKKNREKWNSLIRISVQNRCRIEPGQNKQQMQSFVAKRLTHIFTARLFSLMK